MTGETSFRLPRDLDTAVRAELDAWRAGDKVKRLWSRYASLRIDIARTLFIVSSKSGTTLEPNIFMPGRRYSFGVVNSAQALGDLQVLRERGRRTLRVHLGPDVKAGLALLRRAIESLEN